MDSNQTDPAIGTVRQRSRRRATAPGVSAATASAMAGPDLPPGPASSMSA